MYPNSRPIIAAPSAKEDQLAFDASTMKFFWGDDIKNRENDNNAAMTYVIDSDANGLIVSGIAFAHILYKVFAPTTMSIGHI